VTSIQNPGEKTAWKGTTWKNEKHMIRVQEDNINMDLMEIVVILYNGRHWISSTGTLGSITRTLVCIISSRCSNQNHFSQRMDHWKNW
jgi:hypothetical protein